MLKVKDKEKSWKHLEKNNLTLPDINTVRLTVDFLAETMEARRQWHNTFKGLKEKNCQPIILYPEKLSFKNEGEIKSFSDKSREFVDSRPDLQKYTKGSSSS